nr:protein GPR107-like [Ipomoea batatas]
MPPCSSPFFPCSFHLLVPSLSLRSGSLQVRSDNKPVIPYRTNSRFTHRWPSPTQRFPISFDGPHNFGPYPIGFFLCHPRDPDGNSSGRLIRRDQLRYLQSPVTPMVVFSFDNSPHGNSPLIAEYVVSDGPVQSQSSRDCLAQLAISMDVRSAMYNLEGKSGDKRDYLPAGKTILPGRYVMDETTPYGIDWMTWKEVFFVLSMLICCCAVLFPICFGIKESSRKSSIADIGLNAGVGKGPQQTEEISVTSEDDAVTLVDGEKLKMELVGPIFCIYPLQRRGFWLYPVLRGYGSGMRYLDSHKLGVGSANMDLRLRGCERRHAVPGPEPALEAELACNFSIASEGRLNDSLRQSAAYLKARVNPDDLHGCLSCRHGRLSGGGSHRNGMP